MYCLPRDNLHRHANFETSVRTGWQREGGECKKFRRLDPHCFYPLGGEQQTVFLQILLAPPPTLANLFSHKETKHTPPSYTPRRLKFWFYRTAAATQNLKLTKISMYTVYSSPKSQDFGIEASKRYIIIPVPVLRIRIRPDPN